jgi:hypothetical protein
MNLPVAGNGENHLVIGKIISKMRNQIIWHCSHVADIQGDRVVLQCAQLDHVEAFIGRA